MTMFRAIVCGKVQGVWFRAWARDAARELGLAGWVRNRADGFVETLAVGDREQLTEYEDRLWDGPPLARVREVRSEWFEEHEDITGFEVRG
ncbi:MAG: acylphosphatase [Desulfovibrionaceae bacterium]|nr:acylphosphatase [Desulfovibrionaceae bacterium]